MTQEVDRNDGDDDNNSNTRCPECGAVLADDDYDKDHEGGDFTKFDCPECEETTFDESIASKAKRISEGDADPEDVFSWAGTDRRSEAEQQEAVEAMNEPLQVEVDEEIATDDECANPNCERTDGLQVTKYGTFLCPDHHSEGDE